MKSTAKVILLDQRVGRQAIGANAWTAACLARRRRHQGSNSAFLSDELPLEHLPKTDSLVLSTNEGRSLPLVPFIVMGPPKDASNACYFYSRTEGADTARFISYHQGDEAEDFRPDPLESLDRWEQDPPEFGRGR